MRIVEININENGAVDQKYNKLLGYVGENNATQLIINHPQIDGCRYELRFDCKNEKPYSAQLKNGKYVVEGSLLLKQMTVIVQWVALSDNQIIKAASFTMVIGKSVGDDTSSVPTYEQAAELKEKLEEFINNGYSSPIRLIGTKENPVILSKLKRGLYTIYPGTVTEEETDYYSDAYYQVTDMPNQYGFNDELHFVKPGNLVVVSSMETHSSSEPNNYKMFYTVISGSTIYSYTDYGQNSMYMNKPDTLQGTRENPVKPTDGIYYLRGYWTLFDDDKSPRDENSSTNPSNDTLFICNSNHIVRIKDGYVYTTYRYDCKNWDEFDANTKTMGLEAVFSTCNDLSKAGNEPLESHVAASKFNELETSIDEANRKLNAVGGTSNTNIPIILTRGYSSMGMNKRGASTPYGLVPGKPVTAEITGHSYYIENEGQPNDTLPSDLEFYSRNKIDPSTYPAFTTDSSEATAVPQEDGWILFDNPSTGSGANFKTVSPMSFEIYSFEGDITTIALGIEQELIVAADSSSGVSITATLDGNYPNTTENATLKTHSILLDLPKMTEDNKYNYLNKGQHSIVINEFYVPRGTKIKARFFITDRWGDSVICAKTQKYTPPLETTRLTIPSLGEYDKAEIEENQMTVTRQTGKILPSTTDWKPVEDSYYKSSAYSSYQGNWQNYFSLTVRLDMPDDCAYNNWAYPIFKFLPFYESYNYESIVPGTQYYFGMSVPNNYLSCYFEVRSDRYWWDVIKRGYIEMYIYSNWTSSEEWTEFPTEEEIMNALYEYGYYDKRLHVVYQQNHQTKEEPVTVPLDVFGSCQGHMRITNNTPDVDNFSNYFNEPRHPIARINIARQLKLMASVTIPNGAYPNMLTLEQYDKNGDTIAGLNYFKAYADRNGYTENGVYNRGTVEAYRHNDQSCSILLYPSDFPNFNSSTFDSGTTILIEGM